LLDDQKLKYLTAFESFSNGYYVAQSLFSAVNISQGINTPIETMIELVYVLHDELVDLNAVVLDIGCGIPCLLSGMSFLNKTKTIIGSEIEERLINSLKTITDELEKKKTLNIDFKESNSNKNTEKIKKIILNLGTIF
jgi:predicted RNA methylase